MRNKKIITLLLAATVAITSVAPSIQVKATEIILVPSGNGGYTVSTATGSSVSTATPVPTETATETPVSNRDEKRWYSYRGIKYWMNNASGRSRVIDKCICGKRVVKMSRAAIRKHIDECIKTGGHPAKKVNNKASYSAEWAFNNLRDGSSRPNVSLDQVPYNWRGKYVIADSEYTASPKMNNKDICVVFSGGYIVVGYLPKKVKKVTIQLKGNYKHTFKVIKSKKDKKYRYVHYDFDKKKTKCFGENIVYNVIGNTAKEQAKYEKIMKYKSWKSYKSYDKWCKKKSVGCLELNTKGLERVKITLHGYGTYILNLSSNCGSVQLAPLK